MPSMRAPIGRWFRVIRARARALWARLSRVSGWSARSAAVSWASSWAVSIRVPSVARRTPGLTSCRKMLRTNQAATATSRKKPSSRRRLRRMANLSTVVGASCRLAQAVAEAAMGEDRIGLGIDLVQLGAQRLDVGIHGALQALFGVAPDPFHQLLTGVDMTRLLQQGLEQQVLVAGQREWLAMKLDAGARHIQTQAARFFRRGRGDRAHAAQDGAHPGADLAGREGFGH